MCDSWCVCLQLPAPASLCTCSNCFCPPRCPQFDDDVEGTGMGEGEGKKDVTDQIEDEEQLLGLKGDEPDKDQAEEAKELGRSPFSSPSLCW